MNVEQELNRVFNMHYDVIKKLAAFAYEQGADFSLWLDSGEITPEQFYMIVELLDE